MYRKILTLSGLVALLTLGLASSALADAKPIQERVRHALVMLPYYSVFDDLSFQIEGDTVVLMGKVTRPTLKSDAEAVVRRIEGIERVENKIQVLPLSPNDDRLRLDLYRAIYFNPDFTRYAIRAVPPIHIIVENGHVTLVGVVATEMDSNLAFVRAKTTPGSFSVTNLLRVEGSDPSSWRDGASTAERAPESGVCSAARTGNSPMRSPGQEKTAF